MRDGALISIRDPIQMSIDDARAHKEFREATQRLGLSEDRELLRGTVRERPVRRIKSCMKQVVGGLFSGLDTDFRQQDIVCRLVEVTRSIRITNSSRQRELQLQRAAEQMTTTIKTAYDIGVRNFLGVIVDRLLDRNLKLRFGFKRNNCQFFCENLLDKTPFQNLVDPSDNPLYTMSFATRPGSYADVDIVSRFDVPLGLTEEYLLDFQYGRYNDSDIIDTLHEYWHDWGNFGTHLYLYQGLFPWDCTEAYTPHETGLMQTCNHCSLAKHLWSLPFDSFSITKLHLLRTRVQYPPSDPREPCDGTFGSPQQIAATELAEDSTRTQLTEREWIRNRILVLVAHDKLVKVAVALNSVPSFFQNCPTVNKNVDPWWDRLKLGGIHRAQPPSPLFSRKDAHLLAGWIHLSRKWQIDVYEELRKARVQTVDIHGWDGERTHVAVEEKLRESINSQRAAHPTHNQRYGPLNSQGYGRNSRWPFYRRR
jgi:hypothetical protein